MLHRVDEIEAMPGPRFFAYAYRLSAYQGLIAAAARREQGKQAQRVRQPPMSLGEWAKAHPEAMARAEERFTGTGGR